MQYRIEEPETESGAREIPMSEKVEIAFRAIRNWKSYRREADEAEYV